MDFKITVIVETITLYCFRSTFYCHLAEQKGGNLMKSFPVYFAAFHMGLLEARCLRLLSRSLSLVKASLCAAIQLVRTMAKSAAGHILHSGFLCCFGFIHQTTR